MTEWLMQASLAQQVTGERTGSEREGIRLGRPTQSLEALLQYVKRRVEFGGAAGGRSGDAAAAESAGRSACRPVRR